MTRGKLYKNLTNLTIYIRQRDGCYNPEQAIVKGEYFIFVEVVPAGYKVIFGEHVGIITRSALIFPDEPWRYFTEVTTDETGQALPSTDKSLH